MVFRRMIFNGEKAYFEDDPSENYFTVNVGDNVYLADDGHVFAFLSKLDCILHFIKKAQGMFDCF